MSGVIRDGMKVRNGSYRTCLSDKDLISKIRIETFAGGKMNDTITNSD